MNPAGPFDSRYRLGRRPHRGFLYAWLPSAVAGGKRGLGFGSCGAVGRKSAGWPKVFPCMFIHRERLWAKASFLFVVLMRCKVGPPGFGGKTAEILEEIRCALRPRALGTTGTTRSDKVKATLGQSRPGCPHRQSFRWLCVFGSLMAQGVLA